MAFPSWPLGIDGARASLVDLTGSVVQTEPLKEKVSDIRTRWLATTVNTYNESGYSNRYGGPNTLAARKERFWLKHELSILGFDDPRVLTAINSIQIIDNKATWDLSQSDVAAGSAYSEQLQVTIPDDDLTPPSVSYHPMNVLQQCITWMVETDVPVDPNEFSFMGPWAPSFVKNCLEQLKAQKGSASADVVIE